MADEEKWRTKERWKYYIFCWQKITFIIIIILIAFFINIVYIISVIFSSSSDRYIRRKKPISY